MRAWRTWSCVSSGLENVKWLLQPCSEFAISLPVITWYLLDLSKTFPLFYLYLLCDAIASLAPSKFWLWIIGVVGGEWIKGWPKYFNPKIFNHPNIFDHNLLANICDLILDQELLTPDFLTILFYFQFSLEFDPKVLTYKFWDNILSNIFDPPFPSKSPLLFKFTCTIFVPRIFGKLF